MNNERPTAFTASLKKMIDRDVDAAGNYQKAERVLEQYAGGIEFYKKQFAEIADPLSRAHAVHQHIENCLDSHMRKSDAFKEIKCKAGCAHCCYNPVVANEEEAQLLLEFCKEEKIEIDWEHVAKQAKFEGNDHEYFLQPKSESRCAFLGEDNRCKVYKHRPASCRKYFVGSDPSTCDDRAGSQEVMVLADLQSELASSGFMDIDHSKVGLLPKMLIQAQEKRNG